MLLKASFHSFYHNNINQPFMTGPGPYHWLVKRLRRQKQYLLPVLRIKLKLIWTKEFIRTCNAFCGSIITRSRESKVPAVSSRLPWLQVHRPWLAWQELLTETQLLHRTEVLEPELLALPRESSFSLAIKKCRSLP